MLYSLKQNHCTHSLLYIYFLFFLKVMKSCNFKNIKFEKFLINIKRTLIFTTTISFCNHQCIAFISWYEIKYALGKLDLEPTGSHPFSLQNSKIYNKYDIKEERTVVIRDYPILSHIAWEVIQNMYFMYGYQILGAFLRRTLTSWKQHRCIKYEIKKHFQFGKKRLRELSAYIQKHRRTHTLTLTFALAIENFFYTYKCFSMFCSIEFRKATYIKTERL